VDSARYAVYNFDIQLGDDIFCRDAWNRGSKQVESIGVPGYTLASLISLTAALSTMFLTVKRLIALSLGTQREQLEQRMKLTLPRPFLLRPPFLLFLVYTKK